MRKTIAIDPTTGKVDWFISKDHLDKESMAPAEIKELKSKMKKAVHFKLYDDDGELYYEGYSADDNSEDAFWPLDWAMADSGCTEIKYRTKTGKYETL